MGSFIRLPPRALDGRIDATYYRPEYVANAQRLASSAVGRSELSNLVSDGRRTLYFGTTTLEGDEAPSDWVPFLTSDDLGDEGFFIETRARRRVAPAFLDDYPAGRLRSGELLVKVKGPNQTTAYIDTAPEYPVLVSGTIWGGLVRKGVVDPYYLVAALSCPYAAMARTRLRTNLNVEFLSAEDLLSLSLPTPDKLAQRYIGDKVRQAERLRERARRLSADLIQPFDAMVSERVRSLGSSRSWRIAGRGLDHRLDPGANHVRLVALREELRAAGPTRTLGALIATPIPAGVSLSEFTPSGPLYVRISDFGQGYWDSSAASVSSEDHLSNAKGHFRPGDVVFARIGNTLGKVGFADRHVPTSSLSNNCSLLRPLQEEHGPWIFWCLRSALGDVQTGCLKSQTAQPKISNDDIEAIVLPDPDLRPADFNERTEQHFLAARCADGLISAAKLLVEHLIDGRITEADLVAAQKALEAGDRSADREILKALRQSDAPQAKPLIADVDTLYALLDGLEGQDA